ncbi:SLAP domain-containing protein [Lactobacillus corticis]|uniref:S-layer protein C-terminal domain-containing protein n=1 Tax=Lactobacillus corticis TaxID=2201249 RepID=A0A916VI26_9LACO|nr:SLAP domain-containing protein [Lactobacillus corticis]GFZ26878.1 hypothetical protein LCB40_07580 [Lactobacillus corticis]
MKFTKKLMLISASAALAAAPIVPALTSVASVQAATIHKASYTKSKVKTIKSTYFYSQSGKKLNKKAAKGGSYTIYDVTEINGKYYYATQSDLAYWLPASATTGKVYYKSGKTTYTLKTSSKGKLTITKTTTTTVSSSSSSKKTSSSSSSKKTASTKKNKVTVGKNTYFYDKKGKRVKKFLGVTYLSKGTWVYVVSTKTVKINGSKYYQLANNVYIKAANVSKVNGKAVK